MIVSVLVVVMASLIIVPLAYANPPDPTWIPGLYDDADYDDVVGLVTDGTGVSGSLALARVEQGPVACVLVPEPGAVPNRMLRAQTARGPPVESRMPASVCRNPPPGQAASSVRLPGRRRASLLGPHGPDSRHRERDAPTVRTGAKFKIRFA